jgi:hypothetical protein
VAVRQCGSAAVRGAIGDATAPRVTAVVDLSVGHGKLFEGILVIDRIATRSRLGNVPWPKAARPDAASLMSRHRRDLGKVGKSSPSPISPLQERGLGVCQPPGG